MDKCSKKCVSLDTENCYIFMRAKKTKTNVETVNAWSWIRRHNIFKILIIH